MREIVETVLDVMFTCLEAELNQTDRIGTAISQNFTDPSPFRTHKDGYGLGVLEMTCATLDKLCKKSTREIISPLALDYVCRKLESATAARPNIKFIAKNLCLTAVQVYAVGTRVRLKKDHVVDEGIIPAGSVGQVWTVNEAQLTVYLDKLCPALREYHNTITWLAADGPLLQQIASDLEVA